MKNVRPFYIPNVDQEPECPGETKVIWEWYKDIGGFRQNGFSANAIMPETIESYMRLWGRKFDIWTIRMICLLDRCMLSAMAKAHAPKDTEKPYTPRPNNDDDHRKIILRRE